MVVASKVALASVALLALIGCRFGGPRAIDGGTTVGNADAPDVHAAADLLKNDASDADTATEVAAPLPPPDARPVPPSDDASADSDAVAGGCGGAPFTSAVCDPVCNTGCPALSRCDVSDVPQTGACVGIWITREGDICFSGATTDSCAVHLTCLEGKCRRLCYGASDCRAGSCCTQDVEKAGRKTGFKVCAPCAP